LKLLSPSLRGEIARLAALAWPIVLTQLALMMMGTVDYMMVGRAGVAEVGAVMLGNVWRMGTVLAGMGIVFGISPIVSQAHGAGDGRGVALALQRGLVLAMAASVPIACLWWFAPQALRAFGQEPELAERAGQFVAVQIPSLPFLLAWSVQREYLQGRGILMPTFWVAVIANVANAGLNWLLVFGNLGAPALGAVGSGISTATVQLAMPFMTWAWIHRAKLHVGAWVPWTRAAIDPHGLFRILRIGGPVALALLLEMWTFQVSTLWAGHLGRVPLAAHSIVLNMSSISFMVPLGISLAAVTRVGNLVGAGQHREAQRAAWMAFGLGASAMVVFAVLFVLLRAELPRLYTDKLEVVAAATSILPIAAAFQLFDGTQVVGSGILRGMGRTRPAAVIHIFGFWGLALPLAWYLTFRRDRGLAGLWWGLALGLAVVASLLLVWVAWRGPARGASLERERG
jgi:MATE family multidrug resistance protein